MNDIYLEDPKIYDGWCAIYHKDTKTIEWRNAYFTNRLSNSFKTEWEKRMLKQMEEYE